MGLLEDVSKISPVHFENIILVLLAVVAPGYLMVIHFWPNLFFRLDNLKLFLLAISLSLPVLGLNTLAVRASMRFSNELKDSYHTSTIVSFLLLFICLLVSWLLNQSFLQFVSTVAFMEGLVLLASYLERKSICKEHLERIKHPTEAAQTE